MALYCCFRHLKQRIETTSAVSWRRWPCSRWCISNRELKLKLFFDLGTYLASNVHLKQRIETDEKVQLLTIAYAATRISNRELKHELAVYPYGLLIQRFVASQTEN